MIRGIDKRLRRVRRDYRLKVKLPVAVILIAAKTFQCLIQSKLSRKS